MTATQTTPPVALFAAMVVCMSVAVTPPTSIHRWRMVIEALIAEEGSAVRQDFLDTAIAPAAAETQDAGH